MGSLAEFFVKPKTWDIPVSYRERMENLERLNEALKKVNSIDFNACFDNGTILSFKCHQNVLKNKKQFDVEDVILSYYGEKSSAYLFFGLAKEVYLFLYYKCFLPSEWEKNLKPDEHIVFCNPQNDPYPHSSAKGAEEKVAALLRWYDSPNSDEAVLSRETYENFIIAIKNFEKEISKMVVTAGSGGPYPFSPKDQVFGYIAYLPRIDEYFKDLFLSMQKFKKSSDEVLEWAIALTHCNPYFFERNRGNIWQGGVKLAEEDIARLRKQVNDVSRRASANKISSVYSTNAHWFEAQSLESSPLNREISRMMIEMADRIKAYKDSGKVPAMTQISMHGSDSRDNLWDFNAIPWVVEPTMCLLKRYLYRQLSFSYLLGVGIFRDELAPFYMPNTEADAMAETIINFIDSFIAFNERAKKMVFSCKQYPAYDEMIDFELYVQDDLIEMSNVITSTIMPLIRALEFKRQYVSYATCYKFDGVEMYDSCRPAGFENITAECKITLPQNHSYQWLSKWFENIAANPQDISKYVDANLVFYEEV